MAFSKLKTRIVSAAVMLVALFIVIFAPAWVFGVAVCVVSGVVLHELMVTFRQQTKKSLVICDYIFALLFILAGYFKGTASDNLLYLLTVCFLTVLLSFSVLRHNEVSFQDVCASFFVVLYAVVFLMHLAFLRKEFGLVAVFPAFIGAWITDTAAYFAGSLFGKHKLIEAISPKKTVEGSVGGILGTMVGFAVYGIVVTCMGYRVCWVPLLILSVLCGIVSQLGDLSASVMKRAYRAKDFGNLIPGHGGLLDRVDSLIFVAPVVYYFIRYFPVLIG